MGKYRIIELMTIFCLFADACLAVPQGKDYFVDER